MYLELAWRNIWRNTRRTLVIITAVVIGVWSMIFLGAFYRGMLDNMLENGKSVLVGDIQIHHRNFREDPSIDKSMGKGSMITDMLRKKLPAGAVFTGRIKVSTYVSNARHSSGAVLVGIDPEQEKKISFIGKGVIKGEYLKKGDKSGLLMGQALVKKFNTRIGKKVILMTRNKNGEVISRAFRIRGIFSAQMESTEKAYLFITMAGARSLVGMEKGISEIAVKLDRSNDLDAVATMISKNLDKKLYRVETWKELLPMLEAYVRIFDGFMYIWYLVVFIAMGFGIVNTSLMAVFERVREFGLLRALGMKPIRVIVSVLTESAFTLTLGIFSGNLFGIVSVFFMADMGLDLAFFSKGAEFFGMSRIIYPVLTLKDMLSINLIILCLGMIVSLYPAVRAARITPVEAMGE